MKIQHDHPLRPTVSHSLFTHKHNTFLQKQSAGPGSPVCDPPIRYRYRIALWVPTMGSVFPMIPLCLASYANTSIAIACMCVCAMAMVHYVGCIVCHGRIWVRSIWVSGYCFRSGLVCCVMDYDTYDEFEDIYNIVCSIGLVLLNIR